jgi:alpha-tubulin suppressor-like RCC1 family protein
MPSISILRALCVALPLFLCSVWGGVVDATYNSASDLPVTAVSYTATGNTVNFTLNHTPAIGVNLTVVKNTGLAFIQGAFGNLSQGQEVTFTREGMAYKFVANYYGGTGNDLVLQWAGQSLTAWGRNNYGQLGDNSTANSSVPVGLYAKGALSGKTVVAVSAGTYHSLALCSDGTVAAWGGNDSGQLGTGSSIPSNLPVAVTATGVLSGKTVVAISAKASHSLALCSDGTVVAWGNNGNGQLGNNSTNNSNVPVAVSTTGVLNGKTVVNVAAGIYFCLALCSDGTVAAWGNNSNGELGNNSTLSSSVPVAVDTTGVLSGKAVAAVSAGQSHGVALCADGTIAAWGANSSGQLGNNSTNYSKVPVAVNATGILNGKTVVNVAAGGNYCLALCSDGTVAAWGYNYEGQLGNNGTSSSSVPVAVNATGVLSGKTVAAIAAGTAHSIALCSDGTVAAWGKNEYGRLGNNTATNSSVPVAVVTTGVLNGKAVVAVAAGDGHGLALTAVLSNDSTLSGLALSSGSLNPSFNSGTYYYTGSVPNGITSITVTPTVSDSIATVKVNGTAVAAGAASQSIPIAAGQDAITVVGTAQDGTTSTYTLTFPSQPTVLNATWNAAADFALTAASYTATGRTVNLTLNHAPATGRNLTIVNNTGHAFIQGAFGNLSQGQEVILTYSGTNYKFVVNYYGGTGNDLVLQWSGASIMAWGGNSLGQLGIGDALSSSVPVAVDNTGALSGKTVTEVAAGVSHSVALCSDGTVVAWGNNANGQLGNNSTISSSVPVAVDTTGFLSGKTVVAVATGGDPVGGFSFALCSDGTIGAWGLNRYGTLGRGAGGGFSSVPVAVVTTGVLSGKMVVAVAAGAYHSLALCSDGTIATWGNSALNVSPVPVGVSYTGALSGKTVISVAAGSTNSLALCSDGTVAIWSGSNTPVAISAMGVLSGKTVVAISAGHADYYNNMGHSLALCSDGTVAAWGYNSLGQLGNNSTIYSNVPVAVDASGVLSGKTVVSVSARGSHSLVVCSDGTVAAWGDNANGRLGNNSTTSSKVPVAVDAAGILSGKSVKAVSAGGTHSLALCADGTVVDWGQNAYGQLGNNRTIYSSMPVAADATGVLSGKTVMGVDMGWNHSLALCSDGTVSAWGSNSYGQFGNNNTTASTWPVAVDATGVLSGKTTVAVSAGNLHSLALCADGTVAAWGSNSAGQLGNNSTAGSSAPVAVDTTGVLSGKTVVAVSAGSGHSLALCSDGTITAWGGNSTGQLGNNGSPSSSVPVAVDTTGVLSGKAVVAISAGSGHSLALCSDGTVAAWGSNSDGQLGNNSAANSFLPVAVDTTGVLSGKTVVAVNCGPYHSLALCSDGTVAAWGDNVFGQLGNNNTTDSKVPVAVDATGVLSGKTVAGVSAGTYHSLARCSDGTMAAWGRNNNGQLGNNSTTNSSVPVTVNTTGTLNGKTVVSIAGGDGHSMALAAGLSNVSTLSGLALSSYSLSPSFASSTHTYAADVPVGTASITVTPTVPDSVATVRVNGSLIASGSASPSVPITEGNNSITVLVTAQDGVTATTYTITVRATAYESWKATTFTNQADRDNPAVSGPNASPAGDGITNLMKYALALNPLVCGAGDLPKPAVQAGYLTLTYRRNQQATDVTYTVEACDLLDGNWHATNTVVSQVDKGGYWEVTVRDTVPMADNPRRFMRLKVNY